MQGTELVAGAAVDAGGDVEMCEPGTGPRAVATQRLRSVLAQLHAVQRKLTEVSVTEAEEVQRCRARLEFLAESSAAASTASASGTAAPATAPSTSGEGLAASSNPLSGGPIAWTRGRRLDLLLTDALLRSGHHETAKRLAAAAGTGPLTEGHLLEPCWRMIRALLDSHDCGPALAWYARGNLARRPLAALALAQRPHPPGCLPATP